MYRLPITFHKRLMRGEVPVTYCMIETHMGWRGYAEKELAGGFESVAYIADGSYSADGSIIAGGGSVGSIGKAARVLSFGSFERTIQPKTAEMLISYTRRQLQHISLDLDNADLYFSRLIASEPFLGRPIQIYVGFEAEPADHISIFKGIITELSSLPVMTVEADEK